MSEHQCHRTAAVLPLRDVVVYPHMVIPLFVGRERPSRRSSGHGQRQAGACWSRSAMRRCRRSRAADDIYQVGTVANILQLLKLPDGTVKVLVEGGFRARSTLSTTTSDFTAAGVRERSRTIEPTSAR
jgi:ATP-dependent Lon protease